MERGCGVRGRRAGSHGGDWERSWGRRRERRGEERRRAVLDVDWRDKSRGSVEGDAGGERKRSRRRDAGEVRGMRGMG